ncbi:Xanthine and CO dehydrogenase maturation factor, XdhC/CoxF family [Catalinimonas alkaloidigena]|uniref:Xanthine and CO dehydrogenase maturation factor, XdhC/CoxF family n=1 Tax=Catalinimonas alkaloidigena TaxID=1075417 RepID=A0A1G9BCI3_9BACT|nr:XdhC/CoxI family protein [Catalinimonas alkaloidigena]SDK36800.1 Xanthine and CO dehydrogenase maturation factor, XdhC/CoxF family [Catalinimonas alkaloidigena]
MKEIKAILEAYDRAVSSEAPPVALATVVHVRGSSYRRPGARMLMFERGRWIGAISGGCLEGDALRRAQEVTRSGEPRLVTYDTTNDADARSLGVGLGCQGVIDVLIEPLVHPAAQQHLDSLRTLAERREASVLATVFRTEGTLELPLALHQLVSRQEPIAPLSTDSIDEVLQQERSAVRTFTTAEGSADVLLEYVAPELEVLIFGAGFDAQPVVTLAHQLGWRVVVTDDCVVHVAPKRFPEASCVVYAGRTEAVPQLQPGRFSAAVLLSHNYEYDLAVLRTLLPTEVAYIGILGPRKKWERMQDALAAEGAPTEDPRIFSPIGLDLGAETPEEIALSIVAEIQAFFRKRTGGMLRNKTGPIHVPIDSKNVELSL